MSNSNTQRADPAEDQVPVTAVIIAGTRTGVKLECGECHNEMYFASMYQLRMEHLMYNHTGDCAADQQVVFVENINRDYYQFRWGAVLRACKKAEKKSKKISNPRELILKPLRSMFKNTYQ